MNGFGKLGQQLWSVMRARPKTSAAIAIAVAVCSLSVWSCHSGPGRPALPATPVTTTEPEVRVRVRNSIQTARLEGPRSFLVRPAGHPTQEFDGPLTLTLSALGLRVSGSRSETVNAGWGVTEVTALGAATDNQRPRIRIDSNLYAGRLRIYPRRPGSMSEGSEGVDRTNPRFDIVMVTGIEDYLSGVVGAELYPDWKSPGVFEVQAICARTYALHERERSVALNQEWDLESTEEDQAYKGGTAKAEAVKAVRDTRGVVLTTKGKILRAYYSSTCGGRTASAADTWPTGPGYEYNLAPPIQAHRREHLCHQSPRYRWEVTRDSAGFSKQLRDWGKARVHALAGMDSFRSCTVEKANINDRPARFTITDSAGRKYSISGEQLRLACNYRAPGSPAFASNSLVRSGDLTIEVKGKDVVIKGRGFGHGVGMCQFCAKAMADRGDTWRDMLTRFYPGAKIERAYP